MLEYEKLQRNPISKNKIQKSKQNKTEDVGPKG